MRAIATNSTSIFSGSTMGTNGSTSLLHWKSPLPYLFGSLALTLTLIAVALLFLVCSYRKRSSSTATDDEEKSAYCDHKTSASVEMTPKIVVIMAGDQKPTHLAIPLSSSSSQLR
ncbi:protein GLUTAMINE DUMPER 6-like [Nicotiana sylvestris]|uniref:Protein GLUTAMINE DUMPER 6-like n=1 Tax=Nicotiana sylvestris TaxID=4096 RepID=A0A1U7WCD1_NICSY|nr:PREDICTED: protein GLUTAMINE DUMPER 6-like [Nicotiana sylvestris]